MDLLGFSSSSPLLPVAHFPPPLFLSFTNNNNASDASVHLNGSALWPRLKSGSANNRHATILDVSNTSG